MKKWLSLSKKPSEIQILNTISEDSFITEFSNYSKNGKDDKDIVNYDKKEYFQNLEND